jgi:hypothetical protein
MGKSSTPIIGYRYYLGTHLVLCHGPVDSVNHFRQPDNNTIIWPNYLPDSPETPVLNPAHGVLSFNNNGYYTPGPIRASSVDNFINAPGAYGGVQREGGVMGFFDVMMGEPAQGPNAYLTSKIIGLVGSPAGTYLGSGALQSPPWDGNWNTNATPTSAVNGAVYLILPPASGGWLGRDNQIATWNSAGGPTGGPGVPTGQTNGIWEYSGLPAVVGVTFEVVPTSTFYTWNGGAWVIQKALQPAYRGVSGVVMKRCFFAAFNPYIKTLAIECTRIHKAQDGTAQWNDAQAEVPPGSGDMNPAHIIYECLTNGAWGKGYSQTQLDMASFTAAAQTLFNEGLGLSLLWDQSNSIDDFINQVMEHADGSVFVHQQTSLWTIKLVRNDYVISTLPVLDPTNIISMTNATRPLTVELTNQVTVTYLDRGTHQPTPITIQNIAALEAANGLVNEKALDRQGISNQTLALRVAQRDLHELGSALFKCKLECNRTAWVLTVSQPFVLNWPDLGLLNLVMRPVNIDFGLLEDGKIVLDCIEDVFALPAVSYQAPQTTQWTSPYSPPINLPAQYVQAMPFYTVVRSIFGGSMTAYNTLAAADDLLVTAGSVSAGDVLSVRALVSVDGGRTYAQHGSTPVCPSALISASMGYLDTVATLTNGIDLTNVVIGTYAAIDDEVVVVNSLDPVSGTLGLGRGCLDTIPQQHLANALIMFVDGWQTLDTTEYALGQNLHVKLLEVTSRGTLDLSAATEHSITFNERQIRPYPPGNFRIDGVGFPATETPTGLNMTVSWAHRDRTQQLAAPIDTTQGNIGPEAGVTYNLRVYLSASNTQIANYPGLTTTSQLVPLPNGNYPVRVELESVRGGILCWQPYAYTFNVVQTLAPNYALLLSANLVLTGWPPLSITPLYYVPGTGSIQFTGYAPIPFVPTVPQPGTGSMVLAGYAPTVVNTLLTTPGVGSLGLTGHAPLTLFSHVIPSGNLAVTTYAPIVPAGPGVDALFITGYAPTVMIASSGVVVQPGAGSLSIVGQPLVQPQVLLHFDGANGSTSIVDQGGSSWTVHNSAALSTTQAKFGPSSLGLSAGGFITSPSSSLLTPGANDFTYECWVYLNSYTSGQAGLFDKQASNVSFSGANCVVFTNGNPFFIVASSSGSWGVTLTGSSVVSLNTWTHLAFVRYGNTWTIYQDGVNVGQTTASFTVHDDGSDQIIGAAWNSGPGSYLDGYIDEVRILNGTAAYTANFTPPGQPFAPGGDTDASIPAGSLSMSEQTPAFNNLLLMHFEGTNGSTTFTDEYGSSWVVASGSPSLSTAQAKFGSSSLFPNDGWIQTSSTPFAFGTSDFTVECWIYPTSLSGAQAVCGTVVGPDPIHGFVILTNGSNLEILAEHSGGWNIDIQAGTVATNSWQHVALVRKGGSWGLFLDGVSVGTQTFSGSVGASSSYLQIGRGGDSTSQWPGYIDEFRISTIARYTPGVNFTPSGPFLP